LNDIGAIGRCEGGSLRLAFLFGGDAAGAARKISLRVTHLTQDRAAAR
jgi:hypothetical protein